MNSSVYKFTLGMNNSQSQISIPVMLGDTGREWHILLLDGGKPYIIADGCLAKISIKRPKGTRITDFCTVINNTTIVYKFAEDGSTAAEEGIHYCDITLYGLDGKVITTARFSMVVSERVVASYDEVLTSEDITGVDALFAKLAESKYSLDTAMKKLDDALKPTFADDGNGNVIVSMIGLSLVDVEGNGNIILEVANDETNENP